MNDATIGRSALKLAKNPDFLAVLAFWMKEQLDTVTATRLDDTSEIMKSLAQYHAGLAFGDYVQSLAEDEAKRG